ncbi:MAG: hypothetical protein ACYCQI_17005, partial [Gammaproteobacteria bacterium]
KNMRYQLNPKMEESAVTKEMIRSFQRRYYARACAIQSLRNLNLQNLNLASSLSSLHLSVIEEIEELNLQTLLTSLLPDAFDVADFLRIAEDTSSIIKLSQQFANLCVQILSFSSTEKNTVTIDIEILFRYDIIKRLIEDINATSPKIDQLVIQNAHLIPRECASLFKQMHSVAYVQLLSPPDQQIDDNVQKTLKETSARNRLLVHLKIDSNSDDPWDSYYAVCFANRNLNASCSNLQSLNVYTNHRVPPSLMASQYFRDQCLRIMAPKN